MKKSVYITLFGVIALLFSSCGSLSISQKRYSRGLNIDWFVAKDKQSNETTKLKQKHKKQTFALNKSAEQSETPVFESLRADAFVAEDIQTVPNTDEVLTPTQIRAEKKSNKKIGIAQKLKTVKKFKNVLKERRVNQANSKDKSSSKHTSDETDVDLLILVLLALIIPPLAIYFYFGEIETHFWINILLIVLAGGIWGSFGVFGFGFAVIHALLVIFGVFD